MKFLRRFLGVLVMIAGILGLVLSLTGMVGLWMAKPTVVTTVGTTVDTLLISVNTSGEVMVTTKQALGATIESVDALSTMLAATAASVEDTQPVLTQVNVLMGVNLPSTLESATESLKSAQQSAIVLDSAVKSLENFQAVLSAMPLVSAFVVQPTQTYNPEKPLAESLGEVATNLEGLPSMFTAMATDMEKADDNLDTIKTSLTTMSGSVGMISASLSDYEAMLNQSQTSMTNLETILTSVKNNLPKTVDSVALVLSLFLFWLLAIQVVVLTQGWELYQGTAGRMEGGSHEVKESQPAATA